MKDRGAPVEHVPHDLLAGSDQAQGTGGGNPQVEHGLAAHKLPDAGAKYCATVCHAGVGCLPCTLHQLCEWAVE